MVLTQNPALLGTLPSRDVIYVSPGQPLQVFADTVMLYDTTLPIVIDASSQPVFVVARVLVCGLDTSPGNANQCILSANGGKAEIDWTGSAPGLPGSPGDVGQAGGVGATGEEKSWLAG